MFQVLVDGKDVGLLRLKPGSKVVTAVMGQPSAAHDVEVFHSMPCLRISSMSCIANLARLPAMAPWQEHDTQIIKRTEAHIGTARFSGFVVEGRNKLLEVRAALTNDLSAYLSPIK